MNDGTQTMVMLVAISMLCTTSCASDAADTGDAGGTGVRCDCDGRVEAETFAGGPVIDCSVNEVPGDTRQCVSDALAARRPFVIEQTSIDGLLVAYLLGTERAQVARAVFDQDPSRVGRCPTFDIVACSSFVVGDVEPFPGGAIGTCLDDGAPIRVCGRPVQP